MSNQKFDKNSASSSIWEIYLWLEEMVIIKWNIIDIYMSYPYWEFDERRNERFSTFI